MLFNSRIFVLATLFIAVTLSAPLQSLSLRSLGEDISNHFDRRTLVARSHVTLTAPAAQKCKALLQSDGKALAVRLSCDGGGCSGLKYQLCFDQPCLDGDIISNSGGVKVVVDRMSAPYVEGATIDYNGSGFVVKNPNTRSPSPSNSRSRSTSPSSRSGKK